MIQFPDFTTFAAIFADPRLVPAVVVSILAGAVRGFSGFGSALIYVPLVSAIYDPRTAAITFLLIDVATGLALMPGAWRQADWREVTPLAMAAIFAGQFGTLILQYADPTTLRWAISIIVGAAVAVLASGWRYHGRPLLIVTMIVGLLAGLMGGAVQISGPPVIVYWLGSLNQATSMRANFLCYFSVFAFGLFFTYLARGLLSAEFIALAAILGAVQILSVGIGARLFFLATEKTYRHVAYTIIALSAIVSMPLFDSLVK